MQVLLDENLDWRLKRSLPDHQVDAVTRLGWAGTSNGALLRRAVEAGYEVLVTMDGNMAHQQNLSQHAIAIVALKAPTNRLEDTQPLMARLMSILADLKPGTLTVLPITTVAQDGAGRAG